jgi:hypothetical protein
MDKGTKAETAVVGALRPSYPMAERRAKTGAKDTGDIGGVDPRLVLEVKACATYDLPGWLREADVERTNAHAQLGAVWFKLRGKTDPLEWPVMMRGRFFLPLLEAWTS